MKKFLLLFLAIPLVLGFGVFWFYKNTQSVSSDKSFKDFLITKGASASQVGNNLYKQGLLKSPLAFKIYIQLTGKSGNIQAGEYRLSPSLNLFQILTELGKGPTELWVTIPEGLRREEVALRFATQLGKDEMFIDEFLTLTESKEGKLFPDTYLFAKTATAAAIVSKMEATYNVKVLGLENNTDFTANELLVLASLLERETKTDEERPIVAGILMNRLDIGMALQVDASVQYALASSKYLQPSEDIKWWEPVLRGDLQFDSQYNTYRYPGLPIGPIASPGLSSLEAAYSPEDSDYLYYIHDETGQIRYARNLEEHNANVAKYLR